MAAPKFVEGEVRVVGNRWSPRVHAIKDFLARSRVPYRWLDPETDSQARGLLERAGTGDENIPLVLLPDGSMLVNPDVHTVAEKLGLDTEPDSKFWDLIVVGGGPAGVTASIYAASDGLRTVVVEQGVPGGQISYSGAVENYPGFPEALSGSELTRRAVQQAERFGVEIVVTRRAEKLRIDGSQLLVGLEDGSELAAHTVLLAMGVSFRWLDAPGCSPLVGAGIYYGAATAEASACTAQEIYVLGGGNSAAQAALLLAQYARKVTIIAIEETLEATMSKYLIDRIRESKNIVVKTGHTVVGAEGARHLERITIRNVKTGETETVRADGLFVFIGATPRTDWLDGVVDRDEGGFIMSGVDCVEANGFPVGWPLERPPFELETNRPGVFVAGDVRRGSVKRLTSAAGEGADAVHYIFKHCEDLEHIVRAQKNRLPR
jgi:thioredoxin reductase (NADPH)